MIALWAALLSLGNFIAPMLGGLTATYASWRLAFIIIAILAAIVAAVSWLFAEDSRSPEGRSLDIPGQVTVGLGLFALLYAVIEGPTAGWGSATVIVSFAVALVLLVAFVVIETRVLAPAHGPVQEPRLRHSVGGHRGRNVLAFLGTAAAVSIWMEVIQHQSAIRTA